MKRRLAGSLLLLCSMLQPATTLASQTELAMNISDMLERVRHAYSAGQIDAASALAQTLLTQTPSEGFPLQHAKIQLELGKIAVLKSRFNLALQHFNNAERLFSDFDDKALMAAVSAEKGQVHFLQARYKSALDLFEQAKLLYQTLEDLQGVALQQLNIGILLHAEGRITESLSALQDALTLLRQRKDTANIARALSEIGSVYADMDNVEDAIKYLMDALEINTSHGLAYERARNHSVLGELYLKSEQFDLAEQHLIAAFSSFTMMNASLDSGSAQTTLGKVAIAKGEIETGLRFLRDALSEARTKGHASLVTQIHIALSDAFFKVNDLERAAKHAQWAFIQAERHGELNSQILAQDKAIQAYLARENYKAAFDALTIRTELSAEQLNAEKLVSLARIKAELEMERQAQSFELQEKNRTVELASVRQQNLQNMLALGSLVSLLLFIFLIWSRYNQYLQNKRLAREVKHRTAELEDKNQQLEEAFHALEQVSMRDPLTGLYNRNFLNAQLPGEIHRVQHYYDTLDTTDYPNNQDLVCFLVDIDYFKRINDEHGHLAGDRFLTQFTEILQEVFRQTDLLIRWGGEEFLIVCRNTDREDAVDLADRLLFAVRQHVFTLPGNIQINATCSIGFCALPVCRKNPYELDWPKTFAVMDYCLYAAKLSSRNCWVGIVEGCCDNQAKPLPNKLEAKFGFTVTNLRTSLTNLASIEWPQDG
ncbi:diguanylate cyclase [Aestuariibacter sp. A3R04]|uniref:diguanylate cyclase n=1 Tax=Aestuariibacter sp. A3R04 TaxID=2841571 RepID=UPI001C08FAFF|nr:diguanylate cyclase [Aestuariibacter sp. A3R04]MBU3021515.1 diguanylate cyclase [Aestuariibacter sp. A3R04]